MTHAWKHIALLLPRGVPSFEQLVRGVIQYGVDHDRRWTYLTSPDVRIQPVVQLKGWTGDGMISSIVTEADAAAAKQLLVPIVDTSAWLERSPVPRVIHDNYQIGVLAAEHFLERGFKRMAYYGVEDFHSTYQRLAGFRHTVRRYNFQFTSLLRPAQTWSGVGSWRVQQDELEQWLSGLTKPVGILATNDCLGSLILNICLQHGLSVPDQVAVAGVGDDRMVCNCSRPPLSSIAGDGFRVGYQAAQTLDNMMAGREPEQWEVLIPSPGVVPRDSTHTLVVEDPRLLQVMQFMQEHAHENINVEIACEGIHISRRRIEGLFWEHLGCTPHRYLLGQRLRLATEQLIAAGKCSFSEIARNSGFVTGKQMLTVFRRELGVTPSEYRKRSLSPADMPPQLPAFVRNLRQANHQP